ncbi:hypothetical protein BGX34_006998 [Mortierella sp. NVP85]|nr:hypothetical protein BGX34_006998 [Mortierella sp. NVP85]
MDERRSLSINIHVALPAGPAGTAGFRLRTVHPSSSDISTSNEGGAKTGPSKVQGLARRYSAMAKNAAESTYVPRNSVGQAKELAALSKSAAPPAPTKTTVTSPLAQTPSVQERREEEEEQSSSPVQVEAPSNVADLTEKVEEIDLAETPAPKEAEEVKPEVTPEVKKDDPTEAQPEPAKIETEVVAEAAAPAAPATPATPVAEAPETKEEEEKEEVSPEP